MPNDPRGHMMATYYGARMQSAQARLMQAEATGDDSEQIRALAEMAAVRAEHDALVRMANEHQESQQPRTPAVDLTPDEAAKICGIDADTYNRGVLRLQALKAQGHYREGEG